MKWSGHTSVFNILLGEHRCCKELGDMILNFVLQWQHLPTNIACSIFVFGYWSVINRTYKCKLRPVRNNFLFLALQNVSKHGSAHVNFIHKSRQFLTYPFSLLTVYVENKRCFLMKQSYFLSDILQLFQLKHPFMTLFAFVPLLGPSRGYSRHKDVFGHWINGNWWNMQFCHSMVTTTGSFWPRWRSWWHINSVRHAWIKTEIYPLFIL